MLNGESRKQIKNPYLFKGTFSFPTRIVLFYIWTNLNETKVEQPFGNLYHGSWVLLERISFKIGILDLFTNIPSACPVNAY